MHKSHAVVTATTKTIGECKLMERKFLKDELGLTDEQIGKILAANGQDIDKYEAQVSGLTTERDNLQTSVDERDKQLKGLKSSVGDNDELKKQIEQLQSDNKQAKADFDTQLASTKKNGAIELAMRDAKARDAKAVMPFIDSSIIKLSDDGKVVGLDEQIKSLKEDKSFLFEEAKAEPKQPINAFAGGNPTGGNEGKEPSLVQRIAENLTANK